MKRQNAATLLGIAGAALIAFLATSCGRRQDTGHSQYLTIKGSDTMVHLVGRWAEAFMDANPEVEISVTGGGSGTGIAALLNGTTDICAASRTMKPKESDLAK